MREVAIMGAGPAGLTLARLLQLRGMSVRVFEGDASAAARGQGGSLDLHEDSGLRAIRACGLDARFTAVARPEGQVSRVFDERGTLVTRLDAEDEPEVRPEIDRGSLRQLLLDSVAPGTVVWGKRLERVEAHRLVFTDGTSHDTDVIAGCDGTWSRVRPLVTPIAARYGGVTFFETASRHPAILERVGPGSLLALGSNRALMAQRNGDGTVRVYAAVRMDESGPEERNAVRALFDGWSEDLTALLDLAEPELIRRPLYTCPPDQTWTSHPSVVLLGDAAHVMPPFTGRGANMAMLDAVELAEQLDRKPVAEAIAAYDGAMLARMREAIVETLAAQDLMIAADAPRGIVEHVQRARA